ncbi:MAG: hypothetical protein HRT37_23415 [Alteromonadaceae bacterium]|uniref:hypothetical protein n=1 Tax=Crocosphaera sp. TaxID=2729996 RepID=UPI002580E022|nr:hypothetical protein [Crocosphaera sp.]NQY37846.1 hypothetical protein [Alteromonadaceae bacterium]NQZ60847.1 hypothetical protein [Crocosphaera sp.]
MTVELIKEQIQKFLVTDTPEVLAIKGDWGVGKTYYWDKYIKELKGSCILKSYSYVSLFGIKSIDELKQTVFLNAVDTHMIGEAPNVKGYAKKIAGLVKDTKIPYVSKYVGGIGGLINSVSQLALNKSVICFDDLERHSGGISIKDFMGLVSYFKEQKDCKVVLLLNEEVGDETFEDYKKYKEKVVDRQLHFEPTADESFDTIVTEAFELRDYTRDCCIGLNIKNKRVIKKIKSNVKEFLELVVDFDEEIKRQVIHSTVVLSWCYYCHGADPKNIPEFAFVNRSGLRKKEEKRGWTTDKTKKWDDFLNSYGYQTSDEIDLAVASGIEQGFINKEKLIPLCECKQHEIDVQNSSTKFDEAWNLYHGSFERNEEAVAKAMEEGMRDIVDSTSTHQYSQGLQLLRTVGKDGKADELMELFIDKRKCTPEVFNADNRSFGNKDKKFIERLESAYLKLKPELTVMEILELRKGANSYNQSEAEILSRLTKDEITKLFKSFKGENLTRYIKVFLLLSSSNQKLQTNIDEAFKEIASSSKLNSDRMAKFKVR